MSDVLGRLLRKEINQLRRAAAQPSGFLSWLGTYYDSHREVLTIALSPVVLGCKFAARPDQLAAEWVEQSREELLELTGKVTPAGFADAIEKLGDRWEASRVAATLAKLKE